MMRVQRVHTRIESSTGGAKACGALELLKMKQREVFFRWLFEVLVVNTALHNVYS